MRAEEQIDAANSDYERRFGEAPDFQWLSAHFNNDVAAYIKFIRDAIAKNSPLPDYAVAHGLPEDATT